jgi:hypothetical protein
MGLHDLTIFFVRVKPLGHLFGDIAMQPLYAYTRLPGMIEFVVIACLVKIMSVIINPYSYGFLLFCCHVFLDFSAIFSSILISKKFDFDLYKPIGILKPK